LSAKNAALLTEIETGEKAESRLRQVQKMKAVGQLTGGIAHDFKKMACLTTMCTSSPSRSRWNNWPKLSDALATP